MGKKKEARQPNDVKQSRAFRKSAREAGVDPDTNLDEMMRRLAVQEKARPKSRRDAD
jgi:hypothetical protein